MLFLFLLISHLSIAWGVTANSRIVEGIDKWSTDSVVTSSTFSTQPTIIKRDPFSGTINLSFLEGNCYSSNQDRWEYVLCPYQNVTSKRIMGQKTNLLGVWGHWNKNEGQTSFPTMEYTNGQGCNGEDSFLTGEKSSKDDKETRATISLVCNHTQSITEVTILSVTENNCHYHFELGLPIACSLLHV